MYTRAQYGIYVCVCVYAFCGRACVVKYFENKRNM